MTDLNEQLDDFNNLLNRIAELYEKQDFENSEWQYDLKKTFIKILQSSKPIFITILEDAQEIKIDIERKNRLLEEMRMDRDYEAYYETKQELSGINGECLENNLSELERCMTIINNYFGLLNSLSCFLPQESSMYSEKIYKLTSIIGEIEKISYMR